jgi:hypothetical protein
MKLFPVQCSHLTGEEDDEPVVKMAIAANKAEAEHLCRDAYSGQGFTGFKAQGSVGGPLPGPARVIYYEGRLLPTGTIDEQPKRSV